MALGGMALCRLGWYQTHRNLLASASWMPRLKACAPMPGFPTVFLEVENDKPHLWLIPLSRGKHCSDKWVTASVCWMNAWVCHRVCHRNQPESQDSWFPCPSFPSFLAASDVACWLPGLAGIFTCETGALLVGVRFKNSRRKEDAPVLRAYKRHGL